MDWIRIVAAAGVFILHVAHIFDDIPFQIQNAETNKLFMIIVINLNFWIMPLFFLIAGAASFLSLKKRENKPYIRERAKRLLIPFCTGLFLLALPQDYVEALNYRKFSGAFNDFIPFHLNNMITLIKNSNILLSSAMFAEFAHHVWFLAFLFLFSLFSLPLFRFFQGNGSKFLNNLTKRFNNPLSLFLPVIPLFLILSTLRPLDSTYSGWPAFLYWGGFFVIGFILFSKKEIPDAIERYRYVFLISGIISFLLTLFYLVKTGSDIFDHPGYSPFDFTGHFLWAITAYAFVLSIIGICKKRMNFNNSLLSHLSTGLMPFYLIHLPVVLIIGYFVVEQQLNLYLKFVIIFLSSFIFSILLVETVIKRIKPISFLFGIKPESK
nr:acyltransferase [Spirochaeta cellobiosiphila]